MPRAGPLNHLAPLGGQSRRLSMPALGPLNRRRGDTLSWDCDFLRSCRYACSWPHLAATTRDQASGTLTIDQAGPLLPG
jgi:hypothetical protein